MPAFGIEMEICIGQDNGNAVFGWEMLETHYTREDAESAYAEYVSNPNNVGWIRIVTL